MKDKQNLLQAPACSTREYTRGRYVSNNKNVSLELHLRGQADVNKSKKAKSEKKNNAMTVHYLHQQQKQNQCASSAKSAPKLVRKVLIHIVGKLWECPHIWFVLVLLALSFRIFFFPLSAILIFCLFLWAMQPRSIFRLRGSEMAECAIATAAKETNLKKPNS